MLNMLRDKTARERMAGNARQMIASRFEQGFVRKCLYDFYDQILAKYEKERHKMTGNEHSRARKYCIFQVYLKKLGC